MKAIILSYVISSVLAVDLIGTETYTPDVMDPWTTWMDGPRFEIQYVAAMRSFRIWAWVPYKTTLAISMGLPNS